MSADVARARIVEAIREHGPIPFDAFMEHALYGEGGYFEGAPVGPAGDFVTSPHVHPWFAYGLALALGQLRDGLVARGGAAASSPARLIELGAGDGTLARRLLEILAGSEAIEYMAVERSRRARRALSRVGVAVRTSVDEVGELRGALVFANELLDNLPFRRVRRRGDTLVEVLVGLDGGRLVEVESRARAPLASLAPPVADAGEAALPTGALAMIDALAGRMRESYALLIDYAAERGKDVHGYRAHRVVADVLERPGDTDITAGVDFDAVEAHARARGLAVLGRITQREALLALGFADWTGRERQSAAGLPGVEATRAWAGRSRATLLLEPDGLGAHRWLLLATPGLPAPAWLGTVPERPSTD